MLTVLFTLHSSGVGIDFGGSCFASSSETSGEEDSCVACCSQSGVVFSDVALGAGVVGHGVAHFERSGVLSSPVNQSGAHVSAEDSSLASIC